MGAIAVVSPSDRQGMDEQTVKHLELIQGVVNRLANNSFAFKAWAIVLVAAVFAFAADDGDPIFLLVALIPALAFWGLDAYYLRQERLFRALYDAVRKGEAGAGEDGPFSMNTTPVGDRVASWWGVVCSQTIAWLYGPIVALIVAAAAIAFWSE